MNFGLIKPSCRITRHVVGALCLAIASTSTVTAAEKVTIEGGNEAGEPFYIWRVTNNHTSPIVRIEFPQYGADLFEVPPTWTTGTVKEMNLVNIGWKHKKSGLCFAVPKPPNPGLLRGSSARFSMRVAPTVAALPSKKIVHVVFADETTYDVANVELPTMVDKGSPLGTLLGIAGLFVACVVILEIRKRRAARSSDDDQSTQQT